MEITKIPANKDGKTLRVAAYCRVSTETDEQKESIDTQKEVYFSLISLRSDWEFAGIYTDSISGLTSEKRPGFMSMIKDALDGKIDRILCKSVSRFSRNVAECKRYVDLLMNKNIAVEFEKEHLATDDPTSSFVLSLMSAIAENESRSISENVRWGYRERFSRGEYNPGKNPMLGYDTVNKKLVPNGDAWIVKLIFKRYANGTRMRSIQKELTEKGVLSSNGTPLSAGMISYLLHNEVYKGDKELGKSPVRDFLTKKVIKGAKHETFYLKNDHEAIIDEETWNKVQERLKRGRKATKIMLNPTFE